MGCKSRASSEVVPQVVRASNSALNADKVLEIARDAVAANDTWVNQAEFETPSRQPDGSWSVMVWRLPKTPGGHRAIIIDGKGKVTDYMRGR